MTIPFQAPEPIDPVQQVNQTPTQVPISRPKQLNSAELLFALSCYCYITASKIGHEALNVLDENLVRVQELTAIGAQEANGLSAEYISAEKDLESSKMLASEVGAQAIEPDMEAVDHEAEAEEASSTIIPSTV